MLFDKHFFHTGERGDKHFSHTGGDKHFYVVGGQKFYVEGCGGHNDVDVD